MRVIVGALIAGVILYILPGTRSGPACLIAGASATYLLLLLGPRSTVERIGCLMTVALIAWAAGPMAARNQSLFKHLLGWLAASGALAYYLRPRSE